MNEIDLGAVRDGRRLPARLTGVLVGAALLVGVAVTPAAASPVAAHKSVTPACGFCWNPHPRPIV